MGKIYVIFIGLCPVLKGNNSSKTFYFRINSNMQWSVSN